MDGVVPSIVKSDTIKYLLIILVCIAVSSCDKAKKQSTHKSNQNEQNSIKKALLSEDSMELKSPSLWIYGGPPEETDYERQIVDDWYNFYFQLKGGCTTTPSPDLEAHNKRTDSIMSTRWGKHWLVRFEKSVDSLYSIDSMAIAITKADPFIHRFCRDNDKQNDKYDYNPNFSYKAHISPDDNIMVVVIDGYGVVYRKVCRLNYLRASVDLKQKKVIHIDKTVYR